VSSYPPGVWENIVGYCVIPIMVYYVSLIVQRSYKNAIGCMEDSPNCRSFKRLHGQRTIILSILLGCVNIYRVIDEDKIPPSALMLKPLAVTLPFVVLVVSLVFAMCCYGILHVIRIDINYPTAGQTGLILTRVVNVFGFVILYLSAVVLVEYVIAFSGVSR